MFNSIESEILEEALMTENLGTALLHIAQTYEQYERTIVENGMKQKSISEYVLESLRDATLTIFKWLGIDDDYYRELAGYKEYDEERIQEKLMDEYMQSVVLDMLDSPQYSEETWNNAEVEERKEMLADFIVELNHIMGTNVVTDIIYEDMKNADGSNSSRRGYYSHPASTITINENYLETTDLNSYMLMRTLIHEMRHAYQHAAIENPEDFLVSEETRKQWEYNFEHYKSSGKDGYEAYVSQAIEYDAKSFAGQSGDLNGYTPEYAGSWD